MAPKVSASDYGPGAAGRSVISDSRSWRTTLRECPMVSAELKAATNGSTKSG